MLLKISSDQLCSFEFAFALLRSVVDGLSVCQNLFAYIIKSKTNIKTIEQDFSLNGFVHEVRTRMHVLTLTPEGDLQMVKSEMCEQIFLKFDIEKANLRISF